MQCRSGPGCLLLAVFSQCSLGHALPCAWLQSPSGRPQDAPGDLCTNLCWIPFLSPKWELQRPVSFSTVFCFLDPDTRNWQSQAAKGCLWHLFVSTCLAAARENAWNQWIFGSAPACRFTATVQHDAHSCCDVCLVSSLHAGMFDFSAHEASSSWPLQCGNSARGGAGCPHLDLAMQNKCVWGPHQNKIEKSYEISRWVCSQPRRFLSLCFPICLPQVMLVCSSAFPHGSLGAPAIPQCLQRFLLNQVVKLVWINFFFFLFLYLGKEWVCTWIFPPFFLKI